MVLAQKNGSAAAASMRPAFGSRSRRRRFVGPRFDLNSRTPSTVYKAFQSITIDGEEPLKAIAHLSLREQRSVTLSLLYDKHQQLRPLQLVRTTLEYSNEKLIEAYKGTPSFAPGEINNHITRHFTPELAARGLYPDLIINDDDADNLRMRLKGVVEVYDGTNLKEAAEAIDTVADVGELQRMIKDPTILCKIIRQQSHSHVKLDLLPPKIYSTNVPQSKKSKKKTKLEAHSMHQTNEISADEYWKEVNGSDPLCEMDESYFREALLLRLRAVTKPHDNISSIEK